MAADPAILQRIRARPFARGGRVLLRPRANGCCLVARRSRKPLARLRLTGAGDACGAALPLASPRLEAAERFRCARHAAETLERLSSNPHVLELRQTDG